jgi:recombinational DNA repair protein (RecF pathway)
METSLIVSGLSPDFGKLDLLAKGELKLSAKKYPVIDLFREIQASFHENRNSTLHSITTAELIAEHDNIAEIPENFLLANKLGNFLLSNTQPDLPCPQTSIILGNVLIHLSSSGNEELIKRRFFGQLWNRLHCSVILKMGFLHENGFMPDTLSNDETQNYEQQLFIEQVIEAGIGDMALPERANKYWLQLDKWLDSICEYHELKS